MTIRAKLLVRVHSSDANLDQLPGQSSRRPAKRITVSANDIAASVRTDQVVQQNALLVEEATAATESMRAESEAMLPLVSRFRMGQTDTPDHALPGSGRSR